MITVLLATLPHTLIESAPTPFPTPTIPPFDIGSAALSWIPPILQAAIGVLVAGILGKIIIDWWHGKIAMPKAIAGFYNAQDRRSGHIIQHKTLTSDEMGAHAIDLGLWVFLDTKVPFAKEEWNIRVNVVTDENVKINGVLELQPGTYQILNGLVPKRTAYKISGAALVLPKPFVITTTLEVRISISGKVQTQILTISPAKT